MAESIIKGGTKKLANSSITPASGTIYSNRSAKFGNLVVLDITLKDASFSSGGVLFATITDEEFKPSSGSNPSVWARKQHLAFGDGWVDQNGKISVRFTASQSGYISIFTVYAVNVS